MRECLNSGAFYGQQVVPDTAFFANLLTNFVGFGESMTADALKIWPEDAQYPPYDEPMSP